MTWLATEPELAGTPRRPSPPTTTWPSSSAGSSSPRDFAAHALSRPPRKKPGPSSLPGPPPSTKLRNTSLPVGSGMGRDVLEDLRVRAVADLDLAQRAHLGAAPV